MSTLEHLRDRLRGFFPALGRDTVFLDNAGGSQVPRHVIDAVGRYMVDSFSQLGGDYPTSARASATVQRARALVKSFVNGGDGAGNLGLAPGHGLGDVILGPSATALVHLIANGYADAKDAAQREGRPWARTKVVVCTAGHEANIWPWYRLQGRGFEIVPWDVEPVETRAGSSGRAVVLGPRVETLRRLLDDRTLLVAFPQVSNILGETWDCRAVASEARRAGARSFIDGVAHAPHHAPDVREIGCDWYVYSTYKVYGPHMGALYGRREAWAQLTGPNHPFIPREETARKWELGGACHEGCAAINALWDYALDTLGEPREGTPDLDRGVFARAFQRFADLERPLLDRLMEALTSNPRVRVIGAPTPEPPRVCTVSFVVDGAASADVARAGNAEGLGVRWGHFYSKRLVEQIGLDPADGVVRVSLAHYNSHEDVERFASFLSRRARA
ncbi:MAG: aminotransferase class V-fold PLP-dependent enzyme [Phycisphaeraceae bacterium]|nr:MAG: aminotransferase class V-fold PLP-dependent enzyme [Phycisphaeraceae bacterium]